MVTKLTNRFASKSVEMKSFDEMFPNDNLHGMCVNNALGRTIGPSTHECLSFIFYRSEFIQTLLADYDNRVPPNFDDGKICQCNFS